jgi:hypothetical protein
MRGADAVREAPSEELCKKIALLFAEARVEFGGSRNIFSDDVVKELLQPYL